MADPPAGLHSRWLQLLHASQQEKDERMQGVQGNLDEELAVSGQFTSLALGSADLAQYGGQQDSCEQEFDWRKQKYSQRPCGKSLIARFVVGGGCILILHSTDPAW